MKNVFTSKMGFAMLASAMIFQFAPVCAQGPSSQSGPSAQQTAVSDKELRAFAKAYVEYQNIRKTYEPRLTGAQDAKKKDMIRREGELKVKEALQKHGLTTESYNRLFIAVNADEELREKVLKIINQERDRS